jgi:hypothetical protein
MNGAAATACRSPKRREFDDSGLDLVADSCAKEVVQKDDGDSVAQRFRDSPREEVPMGHGKDLRRLRDSASEHSERSSMIIKLLMDCEHLIKRKVGADGRSGTKTPPKSDCRRSKHRHPKRHVDDMISEAQHKCLLHQSLIGA